MKYWWITDNSLITHVRLASYKSGYLIISRQSKSCCRVVHISPVLHISSSSSTSSFSESSMNPQWRDVILLLFQNQNDQLLQIHEMLARRRRRRRGRQARNVWVRDWISRRPEQGLYDRLMVELRNEDPRSFQNFMRMPPAMFDEIVQRLTPRITKATTNWRAPLDPGLKVALTLRHLASGANYHDMQYAWRVPHNTISQ